jgi:hypothetical protein
MSDQVDKKLFDAALKYSLSSQSLEDLYNYMLTEAELAFKAGVKWANAQPVTEEEIEAAAMKLFEIDCPEYEGEQAATAWRDMCANEPDEVVAEVESYRRVASAALSAARKQVTQ